MLLQHNIIIRLQILLQHSGNTHYVKERVCLLGVVSLVQILEACWTEPSFLLHSGVLLTTARKLLVGHVGGGGWGRSKDTGLRMRRPIFVRLGLYQFIRHFTRLQFFLYVLIIRWCVSIPVKQYTKRRQKLILVVMWASSMYTYLLDFRWKFECEFRCSLGETLTIIYNHVRAYIYQEKRLDHPTNTSI